MRTHSRLCRCAAFTCCWSTDETQGLEVLENLVTLDASRNLISALVSSFMPLGLTRVNLSHNSLNTLYGLEVTRESACYLLNYRVQGCRHLEEIDASDNQLTDLSGLNSHMGLKVLRLAGNNIQVVEGIERLKELSTLDLRRNHIAGDGRLVCSLEMTVDSQPPNAFVCSR